jgi:cyanophycin synthetase
VIANRVKARLAFSRWTRRTSASRRTARRLAAVMDRHDTLCLYRRPFGFRSSTRQILIVTQGAFNIANARRGRCAFAAGIEMAHRGGLTTFHPTPFQAPGRGNLYDFRDFRVMIDYCHNAHGMALVAPFLRSIARGRLIVVMNSPGDRRDSDFDAITKEAAPHFDHVILRDDEDLRGRKPGEVTGHLRAGLIRHA